MCKKIAFLLGTLAAISNITIYSQNQGFTKISLQDAIITGLSSNSEIKNAELEINLKPGNFLTPILRPNYVKLYTNLKQAEYEIKKNKFVADVKTAYNYWIYKHHKLNLIFEEKTNYQDFKRIATVKYKLGELDLLAKTRIEEKLAQINSNFNQIQNEIIIAENSLKQKIFLHGDLIPETEELFIYEIQKPNISDTLNSLLSYYQAKTRLYKSKTRKGKIKSEMVANNFLHQQYTIDKKIENLKIELNIYFDKIHYFKTNALQVADKLINSAKLKYEKGEIDYFEYVLNISEAMKIKQDYAEAIKSYNENAFQLEYYIN